MLRKSLIDLTADVIDDRLRAEGFARYSHTWYVTNDGGDHALIELQSSPRLPGMRRFHVNTCVVPAPWYSWMMTFAPRGRGKRKIPTAADGLLPGRITAPDGGPHGLGWTVSDPEMASRIGAMVADLLTAGPTERLRSLLDRAALQAALAARNGLTPGIEAAFAAKAGPTAKLDEVLGRVVAWQPDSDDFLSWARAYAANRSAAGSTDDLR